jgi:hypothetical protein
MDFGTCVHGNWNRSARGSDAECITNMRIVAGEVGLGCALGERSVDGTGDGAARRYAFACARDCPIAPGTGEAARTNRTTNLAHGAMRDSVRLGSG